MAQPVDVAILVPIMGRRLYVRPYLAGIERATSGLDCTLTIASADGPAIDGMPYVAVDLGARGWSRGRALNAALRSAPPARYYASTDIDAVLHPTALQRATEKASVAGFCVMGGLCLTESDSRAILAEQAIPESLFSLPVTAESAAIDALAEFHGLVVIADWHLAEIRALTGDSPWAEYYGWGCEDTQLIAASQFASRKAGRESVIEYERDCWRHLWHPPAPGKPEHGKPETGDDTYRDNQAAYSAALEAYANA